MELHSRLDKVKILIYTKKLKKLTIYWYNAVAGLWFFTQLSVTVSKYILRVYFCVCFILFYVTLFYYYRDGKLYCDADYKRNFVPKCAKCQDYITSVSVPYVRTTWLQ